jgi:hypothetical protein
VNPQLVVVKWIVIALLTLGALAGSFFAGVRWERGAQAIADRQALQQEIDALAKVARDTAQDFRTAARRMDSISTAYQEARNESEEYFTTLQARWTRYWRSRPDLAGCTLDADGVELWNAANAGPAAARGAAVHGEPGPEAAGAPAAAGDLGRPASADGKPSPGDGEVRRAGSEAPRAGAGGR